MISSLLGRTLYLDANVFIYAVELFPAYERVSREVLGVLDAGKANGITSALTLAEILPGCLKSKNADGERAYLGMISNRPHFQVVPVSEDILIHAARIRANSTLKLLDAIHVATAVRSGCDLLLTNDKAMRQVTEIEVILLDDLDEPA